jgi:hypothetical protein
MTLIFSFCAIGWCIIKLGDVPPGTMTLLMGLNGISVGGYIGTSSFEAKWAPKNAENGRENAR